MNLFRKGNRHAVPIKSQVISLGASDWIDLTYNGQAYMQIRTDTSTTLVLTDLGVLADPAHQNCDCLCYLEDDDD